ncbi:unnamed protein product [Rangifer tarandus platyrhynchus]|uniref:Uncharacterized protein n=2 Tax=Rangifer tarandus platyrhynchus TaxID=3082113 RepID=A0ACB0E9L6_RANTA|nr:unnamed protein product [Rangifer tarandus platyrhynchus]CAI9697023.1 unnamed protein product [Rangifer tarandus platyrhynchus]
MQPAAVASPGVAAAAGEHGFGDHAGVRAARAGSLSLSLRTLACSVARVAQGRLGRAVPADSRFGSLCKLFPHKAAPPPLCPQSHLLFPFPGVARDVRHPGQAAPPRPLPQLKEPLGEPSLRRPRRARKKGGSFLWLRMQESEPMLPVHL